LNEDTRPRRNQHPTRELQRKSADCHTIPASCHTKPASCRAETTVTAWQFSDFTSHPAGIVPQLAGCCTDTADFARQPAGIEWKSTSFVSQLAEREAETPDLAW
jgi:hypothetical protein